MFRDRLIHNSTRKRSRPKLRLSFEQFEPRLVLDSTVVFNEVMYHGTEDNPTEWVELYNQNAVDMDMTGWTITGGIQYSFPPGTVLPGGSYLVIAEDPESFRADNTLGPFEGKLSNSGERLELRSRTDRLMDQLNYEDDTPWPVGPDGSGFSLAKVAENGATADPSNWQTSLTLAGTPHRGNRTLARPPGTLVDLVSPASESQVLIPNADDANAAWKEIDFDDANWQPATNQLGFDTSGSKLHPSRATTHLIQT